MIIAVYSSKGGVGKSILAVSETFGWSESDTHINAPAHLTLNREASFQRAAAMREQFIFQIENGRAILAGYNFHPRPPANG